MENFTPFASLIGGILIGLSAAMMWFFNGRIAGISGILEGAILPRLGDAAWKITFLVGMFAGGGLMVLITPELFAFEIERSLPTLAIAGLLVGFGTRLGSGCTSGHGVCGLSRFSLRSLVATLTFMGVGILTVWIIGQFMGGAI